MRLSELAARIGGVVEGDGSVNVVRAASLEDAGPNDLTFLAGAKNVARAKATRAGAIVLGKEAGPASVPAIRVDDATVGFARAVTLLHPLARPPAGIHPTAIVARTARLGPNAIVEPYAVIEDDVVVGANAWIGAHSVIRRGARIGDDFRAHGRVVVRERCVVGNRVVFQDGAVVGADGFGFAKRADGSYEKIPQVGIAVLEDDVEVQANACVDRASLGVTRIGRGVKIDNLAQVGHNCDVGEDSVICGQVGLAGSTIVGKRVTLAGQAGISGHLSIGDDTIVMAQTGVIGDLEANKVYTGFPATENADWRRESAALHRLPALLKQVREMERRLAAIEARSEPRP